ncbi:MAG: hypothetical protein LBR79_05225 [Oscillospiraceae bacterium]|jgi:hypothetical protein|nr:hypothetical protein [Oscillospiraceae bacterium]
MVTVNIFKRYVLVLAFVLFTAGVVVGAVREATVAARRIAENALISEVEKSSAALHKIESPTERFKKYIKDLDDMIEYGIHIGRLGVLLDNVDYVLYRMTRTAFVRDAMARISTAKRNITGLRDAIRKDEEAANREIADIAADIAAAAVRAPADRAKAIARSEAIAKSKATADKVVRDTIARKHINELLTSLKGIDSKDFGFSLPTDWDEKNIYEYHLRMKVKALKEKLKHMLVDRIYADNLFMILYEMEDVLHNMTRDTFVDAAIEKTNSFLQDIEYRFSTIAAAYCTIYYKYPIR